jgi:hypothetical protein
MASIVPYKLPSGKVVRIPMAEINKSMALLGLTKDEAIQMYLEDEGHLENDEQIALERKAKENRITATIHQAKSTEVKQKTQRERVKKADPTKEEVIKAIAEMLPDLNATDIVIVNESKVITFKIGAEEFKVDLSRKRPPKEGKG